MEPYYQIRNTIVLVRKKYSSLLSCSHQLVAWWLGVDELLVDLEEEEAEGSAGHDDQTTH